MQPGEILTIVLIIWFLVPIIAGYLSGRKNRDVNFWVFFCAICPPVIFVLFFLSKNENPPKKMFAEEKDNDDSFFPTQKD